MTSYALLFVSTVVTFVLLKRARGGLDLILTVAVVGSIWALAGGAAPGRRPARVGQSPAEVKLSDPAAVERAGRKVRGDTGRAEFSR